VDLAFGIHLRICVLISYLFHFVLYVKLIILFKTANSQQVFTFLVDVAAGCWTDCDSVLVYNRL